ncbi:MAG: urea transporter, partial [Bacteroidales bacterium]|nr:urea transporter [Bacteroidales bacterium]
YIGFNYILTSVAVGGFFLVPSARSYLWTVILVPIVALITISLSSALSTFLLPVYALPFNIVVLLFLYSVKLRAKKSSGLAEVIIQQNSPEKNLYAWKNDQSRFRHEILPLRFPFFGSWSVSQGHNGEHTHKGEWKHAWDFIITGNDGKQHRGKGDFVEDYFCYGKPVNAAADGIIEAVTDDVPDNTIGDANLKDNWGNTVVIRHNDYLYTSVSHLRPGSVPVKKGDRVRRGDLIGKCGNSGRSPYPHLHFQVQASPFIGSPTIDYSFATYVRHVPGKNELISYGKPLVNDLVSNVETNNMLKNAFRLIPGRDICFMRVDDGEKSDWEVATNEYNYQYIRCRKSGAVAWFRYDDSTFCFTHYTGPKSSLLYSFFNAAYKVPLGFYDDFKIEDTLPVNTVFRGPILWLQDFIAPFYTFLKPVYALEFEGSASSVDPIDVRLDTRVSRYLFGRQFSETRFTIAADEQGIASFTIILKKGRKEYIRCV